MQPPDPSSRWYETGQQVANQIIATSSPDGIRAELDAADTLWNDPAAHTESTSADLLAGVRDTLREHAERGDD